MIKVIITLVLILLGMYFGSAQNTHDLTIDFSGMESDQGKLFIAVYNQENEFLKHPFQKKVAAVANGKASVVFSGLPSGIYAVSSFHDENDNKKMDTRIFGIPKEPIGVSNNAKGFMGPPKFKDAKFELQQDKHIKITVN